MNLLKEIADPELESRVAKIEEYCERKLTDIHRQGLFQFYNDHGPGHSKAVLRILHDLLEDLSLKRGNDMLNGYECFTLYAAAWCHDLGMLKREEENFTDWGFCEQVRETHPVRTAVYLYDNWREMGILNEVEAVLLGNICKVHGSSGNVNLFPPKQDIFLAGKKHTIRPSFLAALLKLADALDANENRLPSKSYMINPEIPAKSREEYLKQEVVKEVSVNHKDKKIYVQMVVKEEYPANVTDEVEKKLEDELKSVKEVLNKSGIDLDFAFSVIKYSEEYKWEKARYSIPVFPIDNSTKISEYWKYIECFLRDFISEELEEHYGGGWWEERVPKGIQEKCAGRKKDFIFKNMATEDDPDIDFADFPDYLEIFLFKNNWEDVFSDHYGKGKEAKYIIKDKFSQLYPIRSTEAHSREPSDEAVKRFEINALDLLCFDKARDGFRKKIKEHLRERILPPPEFDPAVLHEIKKRNDLYKVAQDSNFLENKEEDFKAKRENVFYFGDKDTIDRISGNIVDKLGRQKILFITGQPGVGKSTFLLFFLDKCLKEGIGEWQKVFFLNPRAEKLKKSLKIIDGIMEEKSDEISPEDVLLVIDALHREEEEEEYIDKCYDLFTKILEDKYSLVVTIRDSELAILKEKLGNKYNEFKNIVEIEPADPKKARIKRIFMNYLNYYKIKLLNIDLSFEDITKYVQEGEIVSLEKSESYQEFDKCIQKVVEKSGGVPGYVKYLMEDISRKGELSPEIIEKYPAGMTNFIRRIIERDYVIGDDRVLPILTLFLAKEKGHAVTWEFIKSFIEWGFDVIDKGSFDKEMILDRARNLIDYYTVDIHDGIITQYKLISHWREGIEDILKRKEIKKYTDIESELGDQILTYLAQKEEELKRGQLPVNLETWLVLADVAKLSYERKKMGVLKYATQFFTEHCDDTERCAFLKKTLSSLWQEKMDDEFSAGDCENAVVSLENAIELGIVDASLLSRASDCYYGKGELSKALEHSQRAVELKPAEPTYLGKQGRILEREGVELEEKGDYTEAISKFEDAVKSYEEAVEIIEGLRDHEKGRRRKRERNGYRWRIGYCNKRVTVIRRDLEHMDKEQFKEEAIRCFQESESYERKSNYNGALEKLKRAKELMLEYIDIEDELKDDVHELVSDIYKHIGICYELRKNGDREEAAENYMIYSDLNKYAPDSFEGFKKNGDTCLGWKFYDKAWYCFRKALKLDQNNVEVLKKLADVSTKMGKFDGALKYITKALEVQKLTSGPLTYPDEYLKSAYEERLEKGDNIGKILISICNIADLTLAGEEPRRLSQEWNMVDLALMGSDKEKISEELKNAQILCLWQAYSHYTTNQIVINELESLAGQSIEEIKKECMGQYTEYIKWPPKPELGMESPVIEVLLHLIYRTIQTYFLKRDEKRGQISGRKKRQQKNNLSYYWGWIGGRIIRICREDEYLSKISPNVAVKCFDLSLKLRERNKDSSGGLGWALFYAGRYNEAIQAFNDDLREDMNPDSPASTIGIGSAYNKKGDYETAKKYLRKGAELNFKFRYDYDPQKLIGYLKKSAGRLENLAFLCDSRNEQFRLLREALKVYKMIGEIAQEIKLEDEQNLFKLEAANLEKYISNVEMGVLEDHII